jgi:hypothetical protein
VFLGNINAVTAVDEGNIDVTRGLVTPQSFQLLLTNNGAAVCHIIRTDQLNGGSGIRAGRINGATSALKVTANGNDATTAFSNGVKISSADNSILYFDTNAQDISTFEGTAVIEYNDSGTPAIRVAVGVSSANINGVTLNRLTFKFTIDGTGAAFNLNTTNIPGSKAICIKFNGKLG